MKKMDLEVMVGLFLIAGVICLGYLSIKLGKLEILGTKGYEVSALFSNSGGLQSGSDILIAGVSVGRVRNVSLENYQARVTLNLSDTVRIQDDAIVSIKTKGMIGEK